MAYYIVDGNDLTAIADKIRAKYGASGPITFPSGFVSGINSIRARLASSTSIQSATFSSDVTIEPGKYVNLFTLRQQQKASGACFISGTGGDTPQIENCIFNGSTIGGSQNNLLVFTIYSSTGNRNEICILNTNTTTSVKILSGCKLQVTYRHYYATLT